MNIFQSPLVICRASLFTAAFILSFGASAALPPSPETGRAWQLPLSSNASLTFCWVPAGQFMRGSSAGEIGRKSDEGPQSSVSITRGFWLGETPVTIGQWKQLMGVDVREQLRRHIADDQRYLFDRRLHRLREWMHWPREVDPAIYLANEEDDLPMYFVSWDDAVACCRQLNLRERAAGRLPAGYEYSLPTEAQWEYACRAGTDGPTYLGGDSTESLDAVAWYDHNSANGYSGRPLGPTRSGPRAVKQKKANAWGLHDMLGNIWEWCADWYGPYSGGHQVDPAGPTSGTLRVNRGGSFGSSANAERSAARAGNPAAEASAYRGFRLALAPLHN